ncbi:hypothetical protein JTB14_023446 [Gonioctena quinquepunctata]|nr:hypothetical protein JTB14_023446 [Gonioctena quinquepunctata]
MHMCVINMVHQAFIVRPTEGGNSMRPIGPKMSLLMNLVWKVSNALWSQLSKLTTPKWQFEPSLNVLSNTVMVFDIKEIEGIDIGEQMVMFFNECPYRIQTLRRHPGHDVV